MPTDDINRTIGTRVRAERASAGMTRKQLAAAAGVSERYLNDLENGEANASVGILAKVAGALGQDFASLVAGGRGAVPTDASIAIPLQRLLATMSEAEQNGAVPVLEGYLALRRRASKGIALLGLRGAGKSTLGGRLAERHKLNFVSITREIETRAGMGLADLFNLGGSDAYRALENDVVADLVRQEAPIVLETAGGIVGNSEALDLIFSAFTTVWLKASPEEHLARVAGQGDTRPMRGNPRALEHLRALLAAREPDYARADFAIDTSGRAIEASFMDLECIVAPVLGLRAA